jgi:hypothetical protein
MLQHLLMPVHPGLPKGRGSLQQVLAVHQQMPTAALQEVGQCGWCCGPTVVPAAAAESGPTTQQQCRVLMMAAALLLPVMP